MDNILLPLLIILVLSSFIEFILRALWTPFYFNHGLVIYRKSFSLRENKEINLQILENEMSQSQILYPNMLFRKQPDGKVFFREVMIDFKFLQPVMHGLIVTEHNSINVMGRINWYMFSWFFFLPILLIFFSQGMKDGDVPIVFFISGFLMVITFGIIIPLFTNIHRYNKLISLIQSQLGLK